MKHIRNHYEIQLIIVKLIELYKTHRIILKHTVSSWNIPNYYNTHKLLWNTSNNNEIHRSITKYTEFSYENGRIVVKCTGLLWNMSNYYETHRIIMKHVKLLLNTQNHYEIHRIVIPRIAVQINVYVTKPQCLTYAKLVLG